MCWRALFLSSFSNSVLTRCAQEQPSRRAYFDAALLWTFKAIHPGTYKCTKCSWFTLISVFTSHFIFNLVISRLVRCDTTRVELLRAFRHWGCVTSKIIENMKNTLGDVEELDGFEELKDEDKDRLRKAWEEGHVATEDVPETADASKILPGANADDEEKPKRKRAPAKKKAKDEEDGDDEPLEKPKRGRKKVHFLYYYYGKTVR
jgi:hypothetical protein